MICSKKLEDGSKVDVTVPKRSPPAESAGLPPLRFFPPHLFPGAIIYCSVT